MGAKTVLGLVSMCLTATVCAYWFYRLMTVRPRERITYVFLFLATLGWFVVALLLNNDILLEHFWALRWLNLVVAVGMLLGVLRAQQFNDWLLRSRGRLR